MPQAATRQYEEDESLHEADLYQQAEPVKAVAIVDPSVAKEKHDEAYYRYTVDTKDPDPWLIMHKNKIIILVIILITAVVGGVFYNKLQLSEQTKSIVATPEVNDIYYIDYRLIQDNLRPAEKYRMAKVNDITGDVITIKFSSYFYPQEEELNDAIRYAQLRFEKFFQEKRHNYTISELETLVESGAIVLARRPEGNMLDGNIVVPDSHFASSSIFIPGKKENSSGQEYLKYAEDSNKAALALTKFQESSELGYAPGQVNLAQMYLSGTAINKDLHTALAWFNKSALQAYEPAILKYAIVCEQVDSCILADFYNELIKSGVNIEFTKQADIRATTKAFEKSLEDQNK